MKADDSDEASVSEVKGLTKEELLQYANDPFWVRLRWFFMILFWASWVAMLVVAILIIMWAPNCAPPPSSTWLEQDVLVQLQEPASANITGLGLNTLFLPHLINEQDYNELNPDLDRDTILATLGAATAAGMRVVTHFMSGTLPPTHPWRAAHAAAVTADALNFSHPAIAAPLAATFEHWANVYNVTGFLLDEGTMAAHPDAKNLTSSLNTALNPEIAFGGPLVDLSSEVADLSSLEGLKDLASQGEDDWTYYQVPTHMMKPVESVQPVLLSLMLLPGTPLLDLGSATETDDFLALHGDMLEKCNTLREKDAVLYGKTQAVNVTSETSLFAFTRTMKGTPGYAVAVNVDNVTTTVDFSALDHVPKSGTLALQLRKTLTHGTKLNMKEIAVPGHSGVVVQFVAQYEE